MVNIAIVGAGWVSGQHVTAISKIPNGKIIGVVDPNLQRARERASICGSPAYASLEECLDKADMVYVLTPPSTHRDIALKAIKAGKHIVVEKPVSSTVEDAEIMVAEAEKYKVKYMLAFNMRFRKGFIMLKELVDSGKLGDVTTYWCQRMGLRVDAANKWSTDPLLMTGMSIQSLSHDIDTMRWIAGDVTDVRAQVLDRPGLPGFDDNSNALFSLANGGTAVFQASWSSHLELNTRGVIGTKGTAYVHGASLWNLDTIHWKTDEMEYEKIEVLNDKHDLRSFAAEDEYFINCVDKDIQPTVTGMDGLKALRVSYGILESSKKNTVVKL